MFFLPFTTLPIIYFCLALRGGVLIFNYPVWIHYGLENIYCRFGVESLTWFLIALILILALVRFQASKITFLNFIGPTYIFIIKFLLIVLGWRFLRSSILIFYLFFEASLVPIFLIVLGWGYQPERLKASLALLFYTLTASLPLLVLIIFRQQINNCSFRRVLIIWVLSQSTFQSQVIGFFWLLAFLVKLPVFIFHQWLPKAHVEAPVVGSIILAALLLKLGGLGIYRLSFILLWDGRLKRALLRVSLVGGGLIAILCLRQLDIKVLIAYSSIRHIAFTRRGYLRGSTWGFIGATIIILAHGVCSSALFASANLLYLRSSSRLIGLNTGIVQLLPRFRLFFFLIRLGNIGAPPTLNLVREVTSIIGLLTLSSIVVFPVILLTFFAAAYTLILYSSTQHGKPSNHSMSQLSLHKLESWILFSHVVWLIISRLGILALL